MKPFAAPKDGTIYPQTPLPGIPQYQYNAKTATWTPLVPNQTVTPGTYGSATSVGKFSVDVSGAIYFAEDVPIPLASLTEAGLVQLVNDTDTDDPKKALTAAAGYNLQQQIDSATKGTVTLVNTGSGLIGGPITERGTISLATTGAVAGDYTNATISVDQYGRILAAESGTSGGITGVTAGTGLSGGGTSGTVTLQNTGVLSIIAGSGIEVNTSTGNVIITNTGGGGGGSGTVTRVNTGVGLTGGPITVAGTVQLVPATTTTLGGVIPDGTSITVSPSGVITAVTGGSGTVTQVNTGVGLTGGPITSTGTIAIAPATVATLGGVRPDGTTITISPAGVISSISGGAGTVTQVNTGTGLTGGPISTTGTISMVPATIASLGGVQPDGTTITITPAGVISAVGGGGGSGTVTQVNTGAGLTGGPITSTGTVSIADQGIMDVMVNDVANIAASKLLYTVGNVSPTQTQLVSLKLRDIVSIRDFKVFRGQNADQNEPGMQAAIAALNNGQIQSLYVPAGNYQVKGSYQITKKGFAIFGDGPLASVFSPTANQDLFILRSNNPTSPDFETAAVTDWSITNIGVNYGQSPSPRRGIAFTLDRTARSVMSNIFVSSSYQGFLCRGAREILMNNIQVTHFLADSTATQVGSYSMRWAQYPGVGITGNNTEVFVSNFNLKGHPVDGQRTDNCLIIEAGDGLWFQNGHCGFVEKSDLVINADPTSFVAEIYFTNVYFDGNVTSPTNLAAAVRITGGDNTSFLGGVTFTGCTIKNHSTKPAVQVLRKIKNLVFNGCQILENGREAILTATNGVYSESLQVVGCYFYNNNMVNANLPIIDIKNMDQSVFSNNIFQSTNTALCGIAIAPTCKNTLVGNNIVRNVTTPVLNNGVNTLLLTQLVGV